MEKLIHELIFPNLFWCYSTSLNRKRMNLECPSWSSSLFFNGGLERICVKGKKSLDFIKMKILGRKYAIFVSGDHPRWSSCLHNPVVTERWRLQWYSPDHKLLFLFSNHFLFLCRIPSLVNTVLPYFFSHRFSQMDGPNGNNAPFIRFSDVDCRERYHDSRAIGFCCERALVLHKV